MQEEQMQTIKQVKALKKKTKERFHEKEVWGLKFLQQLRKYSLVVLGPDEVGSTEPQKSYRPCHFHSNTKTLPFALCGRSQ